ncbi:MAG: hypothetical protein ACLR23_03455 [Clostridia bacterium]
MDHNEKTQTAEGIEEAEILEIIDHHRVANVQTMAPLYFGRSRWAPPARWWRGCTRSTD